MISQKELLGIIATEAVEAGSSEPMGSPRAHGLTQLFDLHAALLVDNPYCYCEVSYTRQTGWMAWLCSKPQSDDPGRRVLAMGQGRTPNEAAAAAVESFCEGGPSANKDYPTEVVITGGNGCAGSIGQS